MPSSKKNRMKRQTQTFSNKKKAWKKMQKKKKGKVRSELVKEYWDHNKSTVANLQAMGLSANPNANMKIKPLQPFTPQPTIIEEPAIRKPQVLKKMECTIEAKQRWKGSFQLPIYDQQFCQHMLNEYGNDYKKMARDRKNVFQLTPTQIRKKIRDYKRTKANSQIETVGRRAKRPKPVSAEPMDTTETDDVKENDILLDVAENDS